MKNYTWGTIVPLIGGLSVAGKQVTGKDPDFFLSYTPFAFNEKNVKDNFPNVPHHCLDEENYGGFDYNKKVDFISAVCPCAGLSMLSTGKPEQRAGVNKWLIESANFITGKLKPKVFWGENAPGLYTNMGKEIRDELRSIAAKNGYTFSVYFTNTIYHGIPQFRRRTFYFFWQGDKIPIFNYYRRPFKNLKDYLAEVPDGVSGQTAEDKAAMKAKLDALPGFMFLQDKYKGEGIKMFRDHPIAGTRLQLTVLQYLIATKQLEEFRDWCLSKNMEGAYKYAKRLCDKIAADEGIWDGTPLKFKSDGYFSALISKTAEAVHPTEDRFITTRECMHLMGLPHDYELTTGALNHVFQNVPVCTGADMYREVIGFIEGERELMSAGFAMQSNQAQKVDQVESNLNLLEF